MFGIDINVTVKCLRDTQLLRLAFISLRWGNVLADFVISILK